MNKLKRGRLTIEDMRFIRSNLSLSVRDLAHALERTEEPILKFLDKEQLRAADQSDNDFLLSNLRCKTYYRELKTQLQNAEIEFFESQWVSYYDQFNGDVTHSEEMQIVEMLRTEILLNRSMEDRVSVLKQIDRFDKLIDEEMRKSDENKDRALITMMSQQLGSLQNARGAFMSEYDKLVDKKQKFMKDLKGTRDQRKKNAEDAKTNFTLWLKELEKADVLKDEEFEMEVHRLAALKEKRRLMDYHQYTDGGLDQPIYNAEAVDIFTDQPQPNLDD